MSNHPCGERCGMDSNDDSCDPCEVHGFCHLCEVEDKDREIDRIHYELGKTKTLLAEQNDRVAKLAQASLERDAAKAEVENLKWKHIHEKGDIRAAEAYGNKLGLELAELRAELVSTQGALECMTDDRDSFVSERNDLKVQLAVAKTRYEAVVAERDYSIDDAAHERMWRHDLHNRYADEVGKMRFERDNYRAHNNSLRKVVEAWLSYAEAVADGMPQANLEIRFDRAIALAHPKLKHSDKDE